MFFSKKTIDLDDQKAEADKGSPLENVENILAALTDPIMVLDPTLIVKYANKPAQDLFGRPVVGRNLVQCFRQPHVIEAVEDVFKTKKEWVGEANFPVAVKRHMNLHIKPVADGAGAIITVRDTTMLKRSEEMYSDFVANVSHELRSPLTSLMGFIETLQGPAQNDQDARERFLNIMIQEANRMARLIDDLLSLSRVQIQEHLPPKDEVNLGQILWNLSDILSMKASDRNMKIIIDTECDKISVSGDADQITQVFHNLIDNGIKYGNAGTNIEISCKKLDRLPDRNIPAVAISIRDYSDGIKPEYIPRLTERFYRIDKARSRSIGGTGLGLAIAKHIITRHRGRLLVESKVGKGSTFTVLLPMPSKKS